MCLIFCFSFALTKGKSKKTHQFSVTVETQHNCRSSKEQEERNLETPRTRNKHEMSVYIRKSASNHDDQYVVRKRQDKLFGDTGKPGVEVSYLARGGGLTIETYSHDWMRSRRYRVPAQFIL